MSIKFFPATNEVNTWHVMDQQWTGRISAAIAFQDDSLMSSLTGPERLRIARMAARRGYIPAAYWWGQHAIRHADKVAARKYQR